MRKISTSFIVFVLFISLLSSLSLYALDQEIDLYVNGEIKITKEQPRMIGQIPYIMHEDLAMVIDANVAWQEQGRVVKLDNENVQLVVTANQDEVLINNNVYKMKQEVLLDNGQLWVPLVNLEKVLGYKVVCDAFTQSLAIYKQEKVDPDQLIDELDSTKHKIVIDAGHGGSDPGSIGYSGRYEKYFTLSLAQKIADAINEEPDLVAYMTRTDDRFIELEDRSAYANDLGADLFISIHGNWFEREISGTETYYYGELSKPFASIMHEKIWEATGFSDRGVRSEPYKVLRYAEMPAVLLELGYLSTEEDEEEMLTDAFQDRVAKAVVAGIKQYLQ